MGSRLGPLNFDKSHVVLVKKRREGLVLSVDHILTSLRNIVARLAVCMPYEAAQMVFQCGATVAQGVAWFGIGLGR